MNPGASLLRKQLRTGDYDPEALGAACHLCFLKPIREGGPVPPELHDGADVAVVGEAPGEDEVKLGRPFVGKSGVELTTTLQVVGSSRKDVNLYNALACRPKDNALDILLLTWQRNNKARLKAEQDPLPSPIECCRPRLINEIDSETRIITLGKTGFVGVTGKSKSILEIRGGPIDGAFDADGSFLFGTLTELEAVGHEAASLQAVQLLPTLHPSFVLRQRRWTRAFRSDMSRAFRWFRGKLNWTDPVKVFNPSPGELREFLTSFIDYSLDVETSIDDPMVAKLYCVGIGTPEKVMVVGFLSKETGRRFYAPETEAEIIAILVEFALDPSKWKIRHNGYFDDQVFFAHFGVWLVSVIDTILEHRSVEPELPHRLAYVGSMYTDAPSWKADHSGTDAKTDLELFDYNSTDLRVTSLIEPQLAKAAEERGQDHIVAFDHRVQKLCVGLHQNGLLVDRVRRNNAATWLTAMMGYYRSELQKASGIPDINPNSVPQLKSLFFDDLKLLPEGLTKLGDPSTADDCLRLMRTKNRTKPQVLAVLDALRRYRGVAKAYGTYVKRLVAYSEVFEVLEKVHSGEEINEGDVFDPDGGGEKLKKVKKRGYIMADGRVHPDYSAHTAVTGRLSSSNPNAQNIPSLLRGMFIAAAGNVIVGADSDQIQLRVVAAVAQIKRYLDILDAGGDPHADTALMMFGVEFSKLVVKSRGWNELRGISKNIGYASFFKGGDETVHNQVTSAEDDQGNLIYPDLTVTKVTALRRNWLREIPELENFWNQAIDGFHLNGYACDPIIGRKREFLDRSENLDNEITAHVIQSAESVIMHKSVLDIVAQIPFEKWGPRTGLVGYVHDAPYVECPRKDAVEVAHLMKACMTRTEPGLPGVTFTAKPHIMSSWGEDYDGCELKKHDFGWDGDRPCGCRKVT